MGTRKITIANAHSSNKPTQVMELEMSGGSPWFTYVWIGDKAFTIYLDGGKITVKRSA